MKINKKLLLMLLVFSCIASICVTAFANPALTVKDSLAQANGVESVNTSFKQVMAAIITIARVIAVGVAIVMLLTLAMKYMMAAPGDRADIKKSMIPFVIGAFVLFASSGIVDMLIRFSAQLSS